MTILTLNKKQLEQEIGKIDEKMQEKIALFGTPIENVNDEEVSVEVFPNRPDLLSFQGFSRALLCFLKKPGMQTYKTEKPEKDYKVIIDKSVKKVRPFTACAIVKDLKLNDEKIKEIIDIQEKLHGSYGRNRKKIAVGIYPLEAIRLPITFLAKKPEDIKFQPLEFPKEINGRQILNQHPAGREYANLLKDKEVFPIFQDANDEILSMPPIINSNKTGKITEKTKEVFIECSGFNLNYLQKALNMIVTSFSDMGGKIYSMEIQDKQRTISPDLEPEKMQFSVENINKTLGLSLTEKETENLLAKMGIGYEKNKEQSTALIPAYRTDILHEIDLSEEIAIAYGYDNFIPELPKISTIGEENSVAVLKRKIEEVLTGLNLLETSTYYLSTKEKQFKNINIKEFKQMMIEVEETKTENNILRNSLLASSITILSENSDAEYPQKIFELGKVFEHDEKSEVQIAETEKLCISLCYEKANFTEIKQVLDYMMRMLNIEYEIKAGENLNPAFIDGRFGEIIINKNSKKHSVGFLGEISPVVLKNNKIKMPVASLEIEIEEL
ncbi:MAG: phenylalanine--tRNA ligase subunit beta [Candidatus Nanoarchaeia archaeon]|nr:phenylalanine--tRNA ligase subunit beta [Candidatus Nanoarchaeia archaeon]